MHASHARHRSPLSGSPPSDQSSAAPWAAVGWRALIVVCAFTGLNAAISEAGTGWEMDTLLPLSQFASLLTGVAYVGILVVDLAAASGKRPEPPTEWLRGLLAITLMLVMTVWFTVMEGDVSETWSLFEHLLTPLAVLVDWAFLGRRQANSRWWYPLSWLGPLVIYLMVLINNPDANPYDFLDPDDSEFTGFVAGALIGVTVGGYAMVGAARLRRGSATGRPPAMPSAGARPPAPPQPPPSFGQAPPCGQAPPPPMAGGPPPGRPGHFPGGPPPAV